MVFKRIITATSAVALMAAPTIATAQTSRAPTVAATQASMEPASEQVEGSELRGGFIIPLIALIAIILGICAATDICGGDDDDPPHSP